MVVANGRDGYATRDVRGNWERVDFGRIVLDDGTVDSYPPSPLNADALHYLAPEFMAGLIAGLIAIGAGALAATRRPRRLSVMVFAVTLVVGALVALLNTVGLYFQHGHVGTLSGDTAVISAVIAVIGSFGALATATTTGSLAARWAALIAVIGAVVTITSGGLYIRWSHATLGYRDASLIAVAVAIGGIALAVWLGRRRAR